MAVSRYEELTSAEWTRFGPTAGVAKLVGRFPKGTVIDAGQGAEINLKQDELCYTILSRNISGFDTGEYHSDVHGNDEDAEPEVVQRNVNESAAHYISTAYRLPATPANTFYMQAHGRRGVELAFQGMAHAPLEKIKRGEMTPGRLDVLLAKEHWGTLTKLAKSQHLDPVYYNNRHPAPEDAILASLDSLDPSRVAGILLNYPLNPTSQAISVGGMKKIFSHVSHLNRDFGADVHVLLDMPYSFAAPQGMDEKGRYLKTGVEHVLDEVTNVNWTAVFSMSKLFSLAKLGSTIVVVNPARADYMEERLGDSATGIGRLQQITNNIAELIGGENDHALWRRKKILATKYGLSRRFLESSADEGGYYVVPGSPNMLSLIEVDAADVLDRTVHCPDGEDRVLKNGNDVVTYLLNAKKIAIVNCGVNEHGKLLLRLASREHKDLYGEMVHRLVEGLHEIRGHSPVVQAPALTENQGLSL